MKPIELNTYLQTAIEIALKAGQLLKENLGKVKKISHKGEINLVTEVDQASEKLITEELIKNFPSHSVVAEEGTLRKNSSDYLWYIDPLDGTTNYAHGYPCFAVSLGLSHQGEMIIGVVYNPISDELFYASSGQGAFLNGSIIEVSRTENLVDSLLATGFAYDFKNNLDFTVGLFKEFLSRTQGIRRDGSAALNLCYTACGRFDGFWEMNLEPWDTAGGMVILKEAGGKITSFSGERFHPEEKSVLASNGLIHQSMLDVISPHLTRLYG